MLNRPRSPAPPRTSRGRRADVPRKWMYGLCDCCDDTTLCCTVCLCSPNATGQAYQRATGRGCVAVAVVLWFLLILDQVLMQSTAAFAEANARAPGRPDVIVGYGILGSLTTLVGLGSTAAMTYFVCVARRNMRVRDDIPSGRCGAWEDCCVSYWCGWCSLVQMFRQDGITGRKYEACNAIAQSV